MKALSVFIVATLFTSVSYAKSTMISMPADTGAYIAKADDGRWVTVREIRFNVTEASDVVVTSGLTVTGSSDSVSTKNFVSGMLRINIFAPAGGGYAHEVFEFHLGIFGNASGLFTLPVSGTASASLAPGSYVALVTAYSPAANANRFVWRYKAAKTTVQIISNR